MLKNFIKGYRFVVLTSDLYVLTAMTVSAALAARRALVKLLLTLASAYAIAIVLTRESTDIVAEAAYKKVIRKVHPDNRLGYCIRMRAPSRIRELFILESAR